MFIKATASLQGKRYQKTKTHLSIKKALQTPLGSLFSLFR